MDDVERLAIDLDPWDDNVGVFEPAKVLCQLQRTFPEAEIDETDHQQVRLLRELEIWSNIVSDPERRKMLNRSSWSLYRRTGPTYRFVLPFSTGHRVAGYVRRGSLCFNLPADIPVGYRDQLKVFLESLRMGQLRLANDQDNA